MFDTRQFASIALHANKSKVSRRTTKSASGVTTRLTRVG